MSRYVKMTCMTIVYRLHQMLKKTVILNFFFFLDMVMSLLFRISVSFVLSQMLYRAETQQCPASGSELSIFGWMLQRHIYKTMMADLGLHCLLVCRTDDRCQSFNFVMSLHRCEFSDRTKEARPEDFIPDPDRYYFRRDINRGKLLL